MNREKLEQLLKQVKENTMDVDVAMEALEQLPFKDLDFAKIDNHREVRVGYPEVIYGEGKTVEQVVKISDYMNKRGENVLITRTQPGMYEGVLKVCPHAEYNQIARTICVKNREVEISKDYIVIVAAGTSDLPVVEEAYETAKLLGNRVEIIRGAKVVIVVAGMEGALASVVGGLVDKPIIAVPTSIGYGANLGGISALLSMLNSCASGVSVVNIDNGFGAAYSASMINKLK